MEPVHTDYLVGDLDPTTVAANYQCGHCNSVTDVREDQYGITHLITQHDDGCPVLTGTLSTIPDTVRAVMGSIPATFRP